MLFLFSPPQPVVGGRPHPDMTRRERVHRKPATNRRKKKRLKWPTKFYLKEILGTAYQAQGNILLAKPPFRKLHLGLALGKRCKRQVTGGLCCPETRGECCPRDTFSITRFFPLCYFTQHVPEQCFPEKLRFLPLARTALPSAPRRPLGLGSRQPPAAPGHFPPPRRAPGPSPGAAAARPAPPRLREPRRALHLGM